jgi:CRISPR-associated protein Cas2
MQTRLNAYRIMWLFVMFDLPTNTKEERKIAQKFRQTLMADGFSMMQYSIYRRHCASDEYVQVHLNRIAKNVPDKGHVSVVKITDKQFGMIVNFWGKNIKPMQEPLEQFELF